MYFKKLPIISSIKSVWNFTNKFGQGFIVFLLSIYFLPNQLLGQRPDLAFEHIGQAEGLRNGYNDFVYKDSTGHIWISSDLGVYKYNGLNLTYYKPNSDGLLGKNIQSDFFEDSLGNIWFATFIALNGYQKEIDSFVHIQVKNEEGEPIATGYCLFYLEKNHVLWFKANNWIYTYDLYTEKTKKICFTTGYRFVVNLFPDGGLKSIIACPWISDTGIEYIIFDAGGNPNKQVFLRDTTEGSKIYISNAIIQSDSLIWLCSNLGLIAFDPRNPEKRDVFPIKDSRDKIKDGVIRGKYLYLTSNTTGLLVFDTESRVFLPAYSQQAEDDYSLRQNFIRGIYLDNQDHLWLSSDSEKNIDHSWFDRNQFIDLFQGTNFPAPKINSLIEDDNQHLWVSTLKEGVFIFDQNRVVKKRFRYQKRERKALTEIEELSKDTTGHVWGISDHSVYLFRNERPHILYENDGLVFNSLVHLSDTVKLLSTNKGIFNLHTYDNFEWAKISPTNFQSNNPAWCDPIVGLKLFQDSNGLIYLTNQGNELVVLKPNTYGIEILSKEVSQFEIYSILEQPDSKQIILGTSSGIVALSTLDYSYKNLFEDKNELENISAYAVFGEDNGDFWFTTYLGIRHYDAEKDQLFQYFPEDGYVSNQFELYSNFADTKGEFWIGTKEGLLGFHPDSLKPYPYGPNLDLQVLEINNSTYEFPLTFKKDSTLRLSNTENTLEFNFVAISSYLPRYNKIYYKLGNRDEIWQQTENGKPVTFLNLAPGKYELSVYATNVNGIKGKQLNFHIEISPPLLQTAGFWIPSLIILIGSITGVSKWYTRRKLILQKREIEREHAMEKALQNERDRIAKEMHDDLGGNLSSIELLVKNMDITSQDAGDQLKRVEGYASTSVESMREIIWMMNSERDNLQDLIAFLRLYILDFFEPHAITCQAAIPEGIPSLSITGNKRRNIYLSIKEGINNILKHSQANQIEVDFTCSEELCIKIKDNGSGFDVQASLNKGNGIRSMKERMEGIGGTLEIISDQGTLMIFSIPLS